MPVQASIICYVDTWTSLLNNFPDSTLGLVIFILYTKATVMFPKWKPLRASLGHHVLLHNVFLLPQRWRSKTLTLPSRSCMSGPYSFRFISNLSSFFPALEPSWTFSSSNHPCSLLPQAICTCCFPSGISFFCLSLISPSLGWPIV